MKKCCGCDKVTKYYYVYAKIPYCVNCYAEVRAMKMRKSD